MYSKTLKNTCNFSLLLIVLLATACDKAGYHKQNDFLRPEINCPFPGNEEYVINDSLGYYPIFDAFVCTPPAINFSQFTLLGKRTRATGCEVKISRNFYVSGNDASCIYEIKVKDKGNCKQNHESMNWILVKKVPADYEVKFVVK